MLHDKQTMHHIYSKISKCSHCLGGCTAVLMLPIEILIGKISPSSSSFFPSDAAVTQKENDDDDDVADDSSDAFIHGQEQCTPPHRGRRGCFHCASQWRRRSTGEVRARSGYYSLDLSYLLPQFDDHFHASTLKGGNRYQTMPR